MIVRVTVQVSGYTQLALIVMLRFDFTDSIGLHNVLSFFTGAEIIPPLGFEITPSLRFSDSMLPTASTCALQLVLPTSYYNNEELFKEKMIYAMLNHD